MALEFRAGRRQEPHLDAQRLGQFQAVLRRVRAAAVFKENEVPAPPVERTICRKYWCVSSFQVSVINRSTSPVRTFQGAMQNAPGPVPRWAPAPAGQCARSSNTGRGFGDDRLIEHQHHGAGMRQRPFLSPLLPAAKRGHAAPVHGGMLPAQAQAREAHGSRCAPRRLAGGLPINTAGATRPSKPWNCNHGREGPHQ